MRRCDTPRSCISGVASPVEVRRGRARIDISRHTGSFPSPPSFDTVLSYTASVVGTVREARRGTSRDPDDRIRTPRRRLRRRWGASTAVEGSSRASARDAAIASATASATASGMRSERRSRSIHVDSRVMGRATARGGWRRSRRARGTREREATPAGRARGVRRASGANRDRGRGRESGR